MNSNAEAGKPDLAVSANLETARNHNAAASPGILGVKSRLKLDFRRSPDVIFAVGVGIIAIYYSGWGTGEVGAVACAMISAV